jgi:hypothetical protein
LPIPSRPTNPRHPATLPARWHLGGKMRFWNTKTHVSFGLAALVVSILLVAAVLGLIPDRVGALRDGRIALAESIAASTMTLIAVDQAGQIEDMLGLMVKRNPAMLSGGLRRTDGTLVMSVGDHADRGPCRTVSCRPTASSRSRSGPTASVGDSLN